MDKGYMVVRVCWARWDLAFAGHEDDEIHAAGILCCLTFGFILFTMLIHDLLRKSTS